MKSHVTKKRISQKPNDVVGKCAQRKSDAQDDVEFRMVKAFSIDTCLIEYSPRLIVVPSSRYPTLDHAISALSPNKGGFVIQLKPGIHQLNETPINVDYLHIIGDCCPHAGFPYLQSCRPSRPSDPERGPDPDDQEQVGEGPFSLSLKGRRLTINGITNPDFSEIQENQKFSIVHLDGNITDHEIIKVSGNTLTFTSDLGLGKNPKSKPYAGEALYLKPNVTITSASNIIRLNPTHKLKLEGVILDVPQCYVGCNGTTVDLRRVVTTPNMRLNITGNYYFPQPNIFTGLVTLSSASQGTTFNQYILGRHSCLHGNGNASSAWKLSTIADSIHGVKIHNGSHLNLSGSDFINNCLGLSALVQSHATIPGTMFCGNRYAIMTGYGSGVSSVIDPTMVNLPTLEDSPAPIVNDNTVALHATNNSQIIVPNLKAENNQHFAVVDGRLHTEPEFTVGKIGTNGSLVVHDTFPSDLSPELCE